MAISSDFSLKLIFFLKITFDRLKVAVSLIKTDEKHKKELTNFNNYWPRSDHLSLIFVTFSCF